MRVIIVDDEKYAIFNIVELLKKHKDIKIVDTYTNPIKAINKLEQTNPDVIFLDINMNPYSGIELVNEFYNFNSKIEIVFTTAYAEYALEAFEINVQDYLLKPISQERFDKSIIRLKNSIEKTVVDKTIKPTVKCFGGFEVIIDNSAVKWRTRKTKELFAYLWLKRNQPVNKERIIEDIFPDKNYTATQSLLHTTIYQLRKTLSDHNIDSELTYQNESYLLSINIDSDYDKLINIIEKSQLEKVDVLNIFELYTGELCENEDYKWCDFERINLNNKIVRTFKYHIEQCLKKDIISEDILLVFRFLIQIDPLDEIVVSQKIDYLSKTNQILQLKKFYQRYKKLLKSEYDFSVSEEIDRQYKAIIG